MDFRRVLCRSVFTLFGPNSCSTVALGPSAAQPLSGSAGGATATYSTNWTPTAGGNGKAAAAPPSHGGPRNHNPPAKPNANRLAELKTQTTRATTHSAP